jgi:release factor glutamine methyltransferase
MRLLPIPGVFKPHSDSLMLAAQLRQERLPAGADVLDLCSGSGVLAITAAQCGARIVTAIDVSRRAVLAIRLNARCNGVRVNAVQGDLFSPVSGKCFDLIVSNPPYVPSETDELPIRGASRAWEGGLDGRVFIDRICSRAAAHLRPNGALLLVHSSICSEQATVAALSEQGLQTTVLARRQGRLGQLVGARAAMLGARGLLSEGEHEEILIFRATR